MLRCSLNRTSTQAFILTGDCLLKSKRDTCVILTSFSFVSKTCRSCCAASGETEEDWAASCCRSLEALLVAGASSSIPAQQVGAGTVDGICPARVQIQGLFLPEAILGLVQPWKDSGEGALPPQRPQCTTTLCPSAHHSAPSSNKTSHCLTHAFSCTVLARFRRFYFLHRSLRRSAFCSRELQLHNIRGPTPEGPGCQIRSCHRGPSVKGEAARPQHQSRIVQRNRSQEISGLLSRLKTVERLLS